MPADKIPRWKLYMLMALLILIGATGAWITKLQSLQKIDGESWEHPWFQTFAMFIGETMCLIYYAVQIQMDKKKYGTRGMNPEIIEARKAGLKTTINPFLLAIPASWDCVASAMVYTAYINLPLSVAEMMNGGLVFLVAIASIIFLRKSFYRHHWVSMFVIVTGVILVSLSSLLKSHFESKIILGVVLMFSALWIQTWQFLVEETLLRNYKLSPLKVIGLEGVFGMSIYIVFLTIAYFIKWNNSDFCFGGRVENSIEAIKQLPK